MYKCDMKHISAAMMNIFAYVLGSTQLQWNFSLSGVYSKKNQFYPKNLAIYGKLAIAVGLMSSNKWMAKTSRRNHYFVPCAQYLSCGILSLQ